MKLILDITPVGQPALPPSVQHPAVLMGNEVGRAPVTCRTGQHVNLSTVTTSTEIVPSTSRKSFHVKRRPVEVIIF